MLVLVSALDSFTILVNCTDNAVGNAFDRVGRDLRLPADPERGVGAVLEAYAAASTTDITGLPALPVPLAKDGPAQRRLEYSFAGLISQVKRILQVIGFDPENPDIEQQRYIAKLFQEAAVAHLVQKISAVLDTFVDQRTRPTGIVISGGVGSNAYLRKEVKWLLRKHRHGSKMQAYYPPPNLCTGESFATCKSKLMHADNAAMIAWTAILRIQAGAKSDPFGLHFRNEWSLEELYNEPSPDAELEAVRQAADTVVSL